MDEYRPIKADDWDISEHMGPKRRSHTFLQVFGVGVGAYHMQKIKYQNTLRFLTRSQKTTCNKQKKNYSQLSSQINHPSGGKVEPCLFISVVW